ncbi:MAG: carboxypeptidase-like regulatory domain-containing protein [Planctomycetota bacterium]
MRYLPLSLCCFFALSPLVGCGPPDKGPKTVTAKGILTLDGEPVEGASIVFIPDGGEYPARSSTDSAGRFSLDAFEYKPGAVPGNYQAIVQRTIVTEAEAAPAGSEEAEHAAQGDGGNERVYNDLPKKYAQPSDEMKFSIPETGIEDLTLELKSK